MDRKWHDLTTTIIRRWQITNQRHTGRCSSSSSSHLLASIKFPITYKVTLKTVSPVLLFLLVLSVVLQCPKYSHTYKQHMTAILIFPQILKQLEPTDKKKWIAIPTHTQRALTHSHTVHGHRYTYVQKFYIYCFFNSNWCINRAHLSLLGLALHHTTFMNRCIYGCIHCSLYVARKNRRAKIAPNRKKMWAKKEINKNKIVEK